MIIKRTESGELVLTAGEGRVELVLRHWGKYTDRATYGIALNSNAVELWREEGGGRRAVLLTEELKEDEARQIRDYIMRVRSFAGFYELLLYLLYIRRKLGHADSRL